MKVVYIAHPLGHGDDRENNRARAARWVAWAARYAAPVADWIILSGEWHEAPDLRARGLSIDCELVARCDEVWLVSDRVSNGMLLEAAAASARGIPVVDLTYARYVEPPAHDTPIDAYDMLSRGDVSQDGDEYWTADGWRPARGAEVIEDGFALMRRPSPLSRERLGRLVREVWIDWAREQSQPKPSWLTAWNDLEESDREVDRRIGEAIREVVESCKR